MSGVQRSLLSWTALALLLSAGTSLDPAIENKLPGIVKFIKKLEWDQFCAAVNIPLDQVKTHKVEKSMFEEKYIEKNQKYDHAERLVLEHINNAWRNKYENNFLLLYTYLSPCAHRCANPKNPDQNILGLIGLMTNWPQHALVFQKPYNPKDKHGNPQFSEDDLKNALKALAEKIGYTNIFRCYTLDNTFQCIRCFPEQNRVDDKCIESKDQQQGPSRVSGAGAKRAQPPGPSSTAKKGRRDSDSDSDMSISSGSNG